MKKLLSLLLVPLLSATVFFGCFNKAEYSSAQVNAKFAEYMDSYISYGQNNVFKYNLFAKSSELDEETLALTESLPNSYIYEKIMYITYDNTNSLNSAVNATHGVILGGNLNVQYHQLKTVYQKILSLTFNYYANWAPNFYAHSDNVTKKESTALYNKLEALMSENESFVTEKNRLELEINSSAGLNSTIMGSLLNEFNYKYNRLIEKSFSFVNYFMNLHKKYNFPTETINLQSAKRLVDETALKIAESVYYDMVKAFETTNRVVLYQLASGSYETEGRYNLLLSPVWNAIIPVTPTSLLFSNVLDVEVAEEVTVQNILESEDADQELVTLVQNKIKTLNNTNRLFDQQYALYKKAYSNVNMLYYNAYRSLSTNSLFEFSTLSLKEQGNLNLLRDFNYNYVALLGNALNEVKNLYN